MTAFVVMRFFGTSGIYALCNGASGVRLLLRPLRNSFFRLIDWSIALLL